MALIIPANYDPHLTVRETQEAIKYIRDTFQKEFGKEMHLERISAPLFVTRSSGLNDNLNGVERPVQFDIAAIPGETVEVKDGKVYINGSDTPLDEPYLPEPMEGSYGPYEVPEGCYFMMGDNRNNSLDARFWDNKFVAKNKIVAKVLFCYYPFNRIGKVN
mgnify:CR=1 FL=1